MSNVHVGVSLLTFTFSVCPVGVFVCFCSHLSFLNIIKCYMDGQLDKLLASLAAHCRVYLLYLFPLLYLVYCTVTNKYDDDDI